jgi:hypothetical protein
MAQTRRLCARLPLSRFVLLFTSPLLLARVRVDAAPSASASAAAPAPASAAPAACVFSTPAGTFDLAPLGAVRADSPQDGGTIWSALFGACADLDASAAEGLCGSAAPSPAPAPALLAEGGACHALGRLAQRSVAPLVANSSGRRRRVGVTVAFGGGDACGGDAVARSVSIDVMCADVARARAVRVAEGGAGRTCAVAATVESRAGCPLECARDAATGAVCGGEGRGVCGIADAAEGGAAKCVCFRGYSGSVCAADAASFMAYLAPSTLFVELAPALLLLALCVFFRCMWQRQSATFVSTQAFRRCADLPCQPLALSLGIPGFDQTARLRMRALAAGSLLIFVLSHTPTPPHQSRAAVSRLSREVVTEPALPCAGLLNGTFSIPEILALEPSDASVRVDVGEERGLRITGTSFCSGMFCYFGGDGNTKLVAEDVLQTSATCPFPAGSFSRKFWFIPE